MLDVIYYKLDCQVNPICKNQLVFRNLDEQNAEAFQHRDKLYYLAVKKISCGTEILARYEKQYAEQLERSEETQERQDRQTGPRDRQLEAECKKMGKFMMCF